ncbi:MAG: cytochrome P450 [Rubrivivax sp.]|nr:MAG: cytochrome P450 [Rubrivivax sp.]
MTTTTTTRPPSAAAKLRELSELPGPTSLPLVGNAFQVSRERIHQGVEQWSQRHGALFLAHFGPTPVLVVSDHELIGAILRARPDDFNRSERLAIISREMNLKLGLFAAEGEAWRHQRRMVMASFAPGHVRAYFPSLLKVTQRLGTRWQKAAQSGASIDLQSDLMRFTVDAITGLAFGADVNTLESDEDIIQRHLDKIFPALFTRILTLVPYWRVFKLPSDRDLDRSVAAVQQAIDGFIAQARQRLQADPSRRDAPPNLLEAMIVAADQADSGVNDQDVADNVLTMLLAGEDTTANTLAWMIHLLQRNPHTLQRAQAEVRRLAGDPAAYTPESMAQLDYLEACMHETMRLKPVAPFLPLQASRDTVVGDVRVPEGTLIWNVMRHDSVSEQHFDDAAAFKPERWLAEGQGPRHNASHAKRVSMPFGAGPRVCPGRYLALLEMKMAMAMLLSRFDIVSVDTPDGREAQEHMAFTMEPVGLTMRLRERRA